MKIGILYVGIGRYIQLWDDFYKSCEKHFITNTEKHYFLVTDSTMPESSNVTIVHQDDLGWPGNVVFRYLFFLRIKEQLKGFDYLFFFNGNTRFKTNITAEEFLPTEEEGGLISLTWKTGNEDPHTYGFERRKESAAYVPFESKSLYLQSGITGGLNRQYIELLEACHQLTMTDFNNGIIPCAHDESIYNKYMIGRRAKLLHSEYGRPSQRDKEHTAKIVFQRKEDLLGHAYLRTFKNRPHTNTWFRKLIHRIGL